MILTLPKVSKLVPVPVVWSVEGPVLLLGVAPDPSIHSNLPLLSLFVDQCGQNPLKSKSQSRGPVKIKNNRNQSEHWANNKPVTYFQRKLLYILVQEEDLVGERLPVSEIIRW